MSSSTVKSSIEKFVEMQEIFSNLAREFYNNGEVDKGDEAMKAAEDAYELSIGYESKS